MKLNLIVILLMLFTLFIFTSNSYSWLNPNEEVSTQQTEEHELMIPSSVPAEVIVKLKEDVLIFPKGKTKTDINEVVINSPQLNYMFVSYGVGTIEKVFRSLEQINDSSLSLEKKAQIDRLRKKLSNTFKIKIADKDVKILVKKLRKLPEVVYAEPNYLYTVQLVPNDPMYPDQWAHQNIHSEAGWNITTGNPDIKIAIIDTGVDWQHPDLNANIWQNLGEDADGDGHTLELVGSEWQLDPGDLNNIDDDNNGYIDDLIGWDAVEIDLQEYINAGYTPLEGEDYTTPDNDPMDFHGHGTHVSGIANAVTNNQTGVAGVSWDSRILPIRAGFAIGLQGSTAIYGFLEDDDIANAFTYAILAGADVINMSWGGSEANLIYDAIQAAYSENIILIAAAGNSGTHNTTNAYPAVYEEVCAVAATSSGDLWVPYSNYGIWVDVCAPGGIAGAGGILSTLPNASYGYHMGTSMACPHVVGLAGLIKGQYNELNPTNNAVVNTIITSADNIDEINNQYAQGEINFSGLLGSGRINVERALSIPLVDGAPQDRRIYLHPGENQDFSVTVYNLTGNPVTYSWELDGEVISTNQEYQYTASEIGDDVLKALVTLDGETNFYKWTIVTANVFVEGEISGVWTLENSPYIVIGDASVPIGQTLTIEPGVKVLFDGLYKLTVNGQLNAIGDNSYDDGRITFSRYQPIGEWLGIDFIDTEQENRLEYCLIEYVASYGGAIYCENSSPIIVNSNISDNTAISGGGIYLLNSQAVIDTCNVVDNLQKGIVCDNSNPTIINNILTANTGNGYDNSRGIYCINNSSPLIENNTISYSGEGSKGIRCSYGSSPTIKNNIISNSGIGILFEYGSSGVIYNNILSDNANGILFSGNSSANIINNTVVNNINWGVHCEEGSSVDILNSIIYFNDGGQIIYDNINDVNVNYTCIGGSFPYGVGNIFNDPLFADPTNNNYLFQPNSPCIDAGNPHQEYNDPDGTRNDMGAYGGPGASQSGVINRPVIIVTAPDFDFGLIGVGETSIKEFSIENDGIGNLRGTIIMPENSNFFIDNGTGNWVTSLNFSIPHNNTQRFTVAFIPSEPGSFSGDMVINHNSPFSPEFNFPLSGEATDYTILSGTISGTLTLENSPYLIMDDVYIENTLSIESGVQIYFIGNLHANNATLNAIGTPQANIIFHPFTGQQSFSITASHGSINMEYCDIEGNLSVYNESSLLMSYSNVNNIYLEGSSININFSSVGSMSISYDLSFICHHNVISTINLMLYTQEDYLLENCDILTQLDFSNFADGLLKLHNCIVMGPVYRNGPSASISVTYCDVLGGQGSIIGFEPIIYENNITADPLFIDPINGNYYLQPTSPCIDAGDPLSPLDPDGTRADMGAFYYDQSRIRK